jgi:DNA-binding CsgD family transcriptional regulator
LWWTDGPRAAAAAIRPVADAVRPLRLPQLQAGVDAMAEMLDVAARVARGDAAAAQVAARPRPDADSAGIGPHRWRYAQFLVALIEQDLPAAEAALGGGVLSLLLEKAVSPPLPLVGAWALLRAVNGDPAAGQEARTLPATQVRANRGAFAYADAVVHGRAGRPDQAAALLVAGDAELADLPWWHRLLHTAVLRCAVEDGWGDPVPLLRADLAAHEQAGDLALERTCRDLLRRAGAPTRRSRAGDAVPTRLRALGVTAREAEVLTLVARGMTNAQVARQLFLSPRTVDTHVANLLAKTGVPSRAELRGFAAETP